LNQPIFVEVAASGEKKLLINVWWTTSSDGSVFSALFLLVCYSIRYVVYKTCEGKLDVHSIFCCLWLYRISRYFI